MTAETRIRDIKCGNDRCPRCLGFHPSEIDCSPKDNIFAMTDQTITGCARCRVRPRAGDGGLCAVCGNEPDVQYEVWQDGEGSGPARRGGMTAMFRPIGMQDVRLRAGEGRLTTGDVLAAVNAELAVRARASVIDAAPSPSARGGVVRVPVEPTREMIDAGADYVFAVSGVIFPIAPLWNAMLSAAPSASPAWGGELREAAGCLAEVAASVEFAPEDGISFMESGAVRLAADIRTCLAALTDQPKQPEDRPSVPIASDDRAVLADWSEFEDDLSDAIQDSIEMDWSSRDGARAVVRWLNENGPRRSAQPTTLFAWLIEAPGQHYLGAHTLGRSEFYWTTDHMKALRFRSREEAGRVQDAVREASPDLFAFAKTLGEAWPVEHGWLETTTPLETGAVGTTEGRAPSPSPNRQAGDKS